MSDELWLLQERIERLENAVGEIRDRLRNCVLVAAGRSEDAIALARGVAEVLAKQIQRDIGCKPADMLDACLKDLEKDEVRSRGLIPAEILSYLRLAHILGNKGTHGAMKIEPTVSTVVSVLHAVLEVVRWYFCTFDRGPRLNGIYRPADDGGEPQPPEPAVGRPSQLPSAVADFTGRQDELERMVGRLCADGGGIGVSAVRGMGGVGKTSLAVKVAHQVKVHFPDAQIVIDLQGTSDRPVTPVEAMSRVIHDFHPDEKLPDSEAELLPLYRSVLTSKRALILLDNARDEEQVRLLVTVPPPAGFIVTSRSALALDGVESVRLDVPPLGEALALLRGIVKEKGTDDELRTVAELCGRLPLALRVAGDFLRLHENWSVPRYVEALKAEDRRLERLKGKTPEKDVEAVLGLSARQLVQEDEALAGRWQMLSIFPADFAPDGAAAVWGLWKDSEPDTGTAVDGLTALLDRSLVQFDEKTQRYNLHDLMRPVASDVFEYARVPEPGGGSAEWLWTAGLRFAAYYKYVLAVASFHYLNVRDTVSGLARFDLERTNIRHGQRLAACGYAAYTSERRTLLSRLWSWVSRRGPDDGGLTQLCLVYGRLGAEGSLLSLRLSPRERLGWFEPALQAARWCGDREAEGILLGALADAHRDLGDARKAVECYTRELAMARAAGNRETEAKILGNLGIAYSDLWEVHKAVECHTRALAMVREIGDRETEAKILGNLGCAHARSWDTAAEIECHTRGLAIAREVGDRHEEGMALMRLGAVHTDLGKHDEAIGFYEQSLTVAREFGDRGGEAIALFNTALSLAALGRPEEAIPHAEQALAIFEALESPHADRVRGELAGWRRRVSPSGTM